MRVTEDKERYVHDDVIEYRCISPSEKAGSATCVNGEWDKPVTCKGKKAKWKQTQSIGADFLKSI